MKLRHSAVALTVIALSASIGSFAQAEGVTQDLEFYGGAAFGDHLVDKPATGHALRLDDGGKFGTRYTIATHDRFGLQLAAGATPTEVKYAQGGDVDVDVTTVDANCSSTSRRGLKLGTHKLETYGVIGAGYRLG